MPASYDLLRALSVGVSAAAGRLLVGCDVVGVGVAHDGLADHHVMSSDGRAGGAVA